MKIIYTFCNGWLTVFAAEIVFLVEWWSGTKVKLYADPKVVDQYFGKEHALLLLNHCYETDWLVGWVICERAKILGVSSKIGRAHV